MLLAPFAPVIGVPDGSRAVVFVVDVSPSVGAAGVSAAEARIREADRVRAQMLNPSGIELGVVSAGVFPDVRVPVGRPLPAQPFLAPSEYPGTDLAAGVRLAGALLPDHGGRRIVVLTDARETRGDVLSEVQRQRGQGIEVDVVGVSAPPSQITLASVDAARERVSTGEPVEVTATVHGPPSSTAPVQWVRDGQYVRSDMVPIGPDGTGEATLSDADAGAGVHVYSAALTNPTDGASTDRRRAAVLVGGNPRALVISVGDEPPSLIVDALRKAEVDVDFLALGNREPDSAMLSAYELVVLSDLPIARDGEVTLLAGLSVPAQRALIEFVRERGGGLIATGGAFGFGPEYAGAPLARMLPIDIQDRGDIEDPNVALAVLLDRSGSMGAMVGGHTKLELAIEASLAAASTVRPDDRVAIASIDTVTTWYAPLAPAVDVIAQQERIRAMGLGGGGIYVYTALTDGYAILHTAHEPIRHVILFSDSADSEEQFRACPFAPCPSAVESAVDLARIARATGITTSVVGIGEPTDTDVDFLRDVAAAGGGRFYLTSRGTDLRRIFVAETRATARSNFHEEPTRVSVGDSHSILTGVDVENAPPLDGYVEAERRPTADTMLVTPDGHPVLASWRYGLGTVVAFTTDGAGRWSAAWGEWPGAGQLLRQTVRFAMRQRAPAMADARIAIDDRMVTLTIEMPDEAASAPSSVDMFSVAEDGHTKPIEGELERIAPGRYRVRARASGDPLAVARVRDEHGQLLAEAIGHDSAADENAAFGQDGRALAEMARAGGGVVDVLPRDTLRLTRESANEPLATWPFVLLLAAWVVMCDLWLRRLSRRKSEPVAALARAPLGQPRPTVINA